MNLLTDWIPKFGDGEAWQGPQCHTSGVNATMKTELNITDRFWRLPAFWMLLSAGIGWPVITSAADAAIGDCGANYAQCLEDWKARRLEDLKGKEGYLNLAGLFWLKEGPNTFGGSTANALVFPGITAATLGTITLRNGQVMMSVDNRYDVRVAGQRQGDTLMLDDTTGAPTTAIYATLSWAIIRRSDQFAVRLRDFENPALVKFQPIDYYPADEVYRVKAILHRYPVPRMLKVDTVIAGLDYNPWSPGIVRFELGGKSYQLEAYDAGNELFFVFGDRTSGRGTYPAGRFLYAGQPDDNEELVLDFNTAQNPPCAFNDFATCPIASAKNRLSVSIPAGERYDLNAH
jgi:uncharacterized protein (DUF1684 family)